MRILGVDDDDIALDILEATVATDGHELVRAANGLEALNTLQHENIQLVISDWMMPGISGIDLVHKVRDTSAGLYTYFILPQHLSDASPPSHSRFNTVRRL